MRNTRRKTIRHFLLCQIKAPSRAELVVDTDISFVENALIYPVVKHIQDILSRKYNIYDGAHENYAGLCNEASAMFVDSFQKTLKSLFPGLKIIASIKTIHGELAHNSMTLSSNWGIEHTIVKIKMLGKTWYVDPTCYQFIYYYDEMPDYWISTECPPYFYPDEKNPVYRGGIISKINTRFKLQYYECGYLRRCGIIEFFQYKIHGKISDIIHRLGNH